MKLTEDLVLERNGMITIITKGTVITENRNPPDFNMEPPDDYEEEVSEEDIEEKYNDIMGDAMALMLMPNPADLEGWPAQINVSSERPHALKTKQFSSIEDVDAWIKANGADIAAKATQEHPDEKYPDSYAGFGIVEDSENDYTLSLIGPGEITDYYLDIIVPENLEFSAVAAMSVLKDWARNEAEENATAGGQDHDGEPNHHDDGGRGADRAQNMVDRQAGLDGPY